MQISRFSDFDFFDFQIFKNYDQIFQILKNFDHKNIFRPEIFDENR